jgi:hypothetical protein
VDRAHQALLAEIRSRLDAAREDRKITNVGGSNYWGPYVTRAINEREHDGPALVGYIKSVLRKSGDSEGWNALLEAGRLDISFEDMVVNAAEPIRSLFSDEDRELGAQSLGEQSAELDRRREEAEATELERDRQVLADMDDRRVSHGKAKLTESQRAGVLVDRAARRRRAAD